MSAAEQKTNKEEKDRFEGMTIEKRLPDGSILLRPEKEGEKALKIRQYQAKPELVHEKEAKGYKVVKNLPNGLVLMEKEITNG